MSNTTLIKAYAEDGSFIDPIADGNVRDIALRMNGGIDSFTVELARNPNDVGYGADVQELFEYRAIRSDDFSGSSGRQIVSGVADVVEIEAGETTSVNLQCKGFMRLLAAGRYEESALNLNFTNTTKPGQHIKNIINNYRFWRSSIMDSYTDTGGTNGAWGGTRARSQQFTTGATAEAALITGVYLRFRYSAGTNAPMTISIRADDGSDNPTGADLVSIVSNQGIPSAFTTYQYFSFVFDAPFQLSTGTLYHIVMKSTGSSLDAYQSDIDATATGYNRSRSDNSGVTWLGAQLNTAHLFRAMFADEEKVRVSVGDIDVASGVSTGLTFADMSHAQALDFVAEQFPANFFWRMNVDNSVDAGLWTAATNTTHILSFGTDITSIRAGTSVENKVNRFFITDDTTTVRKVYFDQTDEDAHGPFWDSFHDTNISLATADIVGPDIVASRKDAQKSTTVTVNGKNFDIYGIKPGHLVKIRNSPLDIILPDGVPVKEINFDGDLATLLLDDPRRDIVEVIRDMQRKINLKTKESTPAQYTTV